MVLFEHAESSLHCFQTADTIYMHDVYHVHVGKYVLLMRSCFDLNLKACITQLVDKKYVDVARWHAKKNVMCQINHLSGMEWKLLIVATGHMLYGRSWDKHKQTFSAENNLCW